MQTAIELMDGPCKGFHELQFGWPPPCKLGLPIKGSNELAWYEKRDDEKYYYLKDNSASIKD